MTAMMPSLHAAEIGASADGAAGLFLHAGWRSCGTWMWERLREHDGVRAFYEPLHEDLSSLRPQDVGLLRPDSWSSGHGAGAPYFAEFLPLLRERGRGVAGQVARFAFDPYFMDSGAEDPALETYIRGLLAHAAAEGRRPVLKFCRSLGRVGWMERRFPDVAHAVILREPHGQWRSSRLQMEQGKNRYFVLAPFVILACNADHPLLAEAADRLEVSMPPRLSRDLGVTTEACWRHVQRLDWRARFRGFLALWVAAGIASLAGQAALIDADALGVDETQRRAAEQDLARAVGFPVDLMPDPARGGGGAFGSAEEQDDALRAQAAALRFLDAHAARLSPGRAASLAKKLSPSTPGGADGTPGHARLPSPMDYVDAAAYVALARATYPLRRAHFHLRRWLGHV
jgi:hypothetical protein